MEANLQPLIERIQREGIETAEKEASRILQEARSQAEDIIRSAEEKKSSILREAEEKAEKSRQRGIESLEHASRNMLLMLVGKIEAIFAGIIEESVANSLDEGLMKHLVSQMIDRFKVEQNGRGVEVFVNPEEVEALKQYVSATFIADLATRTKIKADREVLHGLKVGITGGKAYLDVTHEALAEILSSFLRPKLAEILHKAARHDPGEPGTKVGGNPA